jgi:hypothetical protein
LATRLVVGRIQKPKVISMGINETLTEAGTGLGSFLTAIQNPVVNIVLALGIIGGILAIFYGIASVIRRAVGGATQSIGK